eukprot:7470190-Pyramimonas_sp.AAC.1
MAGAPKQNPDRIMSDKGKLKWDGAVLHESCPRRTTPRRTSQGVGMWLESACGEGPPAMGRNTPGQEGRQGRARS